MVLPIAALPAMGNAADAACAQPSSHERGWASVRDHRPGTTVGEAVMDRSTNMEGRGYQTMIGAASLAIGPLVMTIGDLLHPEETSDISGQAAIIVEQATR